MATTDNLVKVGQLQTALTRVNTELGATFRSASVSGNTINFFNSKDGTGTAAFTFDFPEEIYLSQTGTEIVSNFAWSAMTYPGSTNPNLEGKTVLVLAVRGNAASNPTVNYSFVDMANTIDISGKADKVSNATAGNIATLDANGNLVDSGITTATDSDITTMLNSVFGTLSGS